MLHQRQHLAVHTVPRRSAKLTQAVGRGFRA